MTAGQKRTEEQLWLRTWRRKREAYEKGALTLDQLLRWVREDKVGNGVQVARTRLMKAIKEDAEPTYEATVTIIAEHGTSAKDLSATSLYAIAQAKEYLKKNQGVFYKAHKVIWRFSSDGLIIVRAHVTGLIPRQNQAAA